MHAGAESTRDLQGAGATARCDQQSVIADTGTVAQHDTRRIAFDAFDG
jgi:hypothetical protein